MDCKSCGNDHPENYCPVCGEKAFNPKQLSVKHFVEETFEGFVHFDSKFFLTVKTLITKPGQLSLDYTQGRRVRYMKPIQFFLVVNLIFFVLALHNMYSLPLSNYITYKPFTNFNTIHIIKSTLTKTGLTMPEYEQLFNEKIKGLSKSYIFLFIPFYGLIFWALFFKKKQFFVEHLVFSTHFCAFILLFTLAGFYLLTLPFYLIAGGGYSPDFDNFYSILTGVCVSVYVGAAMHRFYKANIIWTTIIALGIGFTFFTFIQYYRMLLFFKIVYLH